MNAPERNNNARPRWPWALAAVGFASFVGVQIALASAKSAALGEWALPVFLAVAGLVVLISILWLVLSTYPQRRRLDALRGARPEMLFLPMIHPAGLTSTLRWLGFSKARLGNYFVIGIDRSGVTFWKGATRPVEVFSIDRGRIVSVAAGVGVVSRPIAVVDLRVTDASGEDVLVQLSPSFEGWRMPFAHLKADSVELIAVKIRSRLT